MTTRDIILRAEQYANKENASFYSYAEKVAMLNESWVTLYQYLCNTGDKYWVTRKEFNAKTLTLPKDCYQISALYKRIGKQEKQIFNYELFNNKIKIKDDYVSGVYILEYYPTPKVLTFKDTVEKCAFQLENMLDIHNGRIILNNGTDLSVYDVVSKGTYDTPISSENVVFAHTYDDGCIVAKLSTDVWKLYVPDIGLVQQVNDNIIIYNNSVYYTRSNSEEKIILDTHNNSVGVFPLDTTGKTYITDDFKTFTEVGELPVNGLTSIECNSGYQFRTGVTDNQKVYTTYKVIGYFDNAFLTYDMLTGVYYIESLYNDTVINYPNNIFFTFLAVDMALKMRSKQGVDNAQLDSIWAESRNALFNSIEKNKGNHVTIKDVYSDDAVDGIYY